MSKRNPSPLLDEICITKNSPPKKNIIILKEWDVKAILYLFFLASQFFYIYKRVKENEKNLFRVNRVADGRSSTLNNSEAKRWEKILPEIDGNYWSKLKHFIIMAPILYNFII